MDTSSRLRGFTPEIRRAVTELAARYGSASAPETCRSYAVFDFDNTICVFDITYQCVAYQIETMSFALSPEELRKALYSSLAVDHTVRDYAADITEAYARLTETYGPFTAKGLDEQLLPLLREDPYWQAFSAKLRCLYDYVEKTAEDETACKWVTYLCSGMSEEEVYLLFSRSCLKYRDRETALVTWASPATLPGRTGPVSFTFPLGCSVPESIRNLLSFLRENGIGVWICSASNIEGVRAAADAFGIRSLVTGIIGVTQKQSGGRFVPDYAYEHGYAYLNEHGIWKKIPGPAGILPSRMGKAEAVRQVLMPMYHSGPLAGFMDSPGDFHLCTMFRSMKMVVCFNTGYLNPSNGSGLIGIIARGQELSGLDLAGADAAGDTLYLLQGRDENGLRSLRELPSSVLCGSGGETMFDNPECEMMAETMAREGLPARIMLEQFASRAGMAYEEYLSAE